MSVNIGIKPEHTEKVALELARVLADEVLLYMKTRNAHWNVEGPDFYAMHKFFEDQYEMIDEAMDDVAERLRAIGHYAPATLQQYLKLTHLAEDSRSGNASAGFISELLKDHETIIYHLRENINRFAGEYHDLGSSDFITGLMEHHEKMAWMLRAHQGRK